VAIGIDRTGAWQFNGFMPIYEYQAADTEQACDYCRDGFECLRQLSDPPLSCCPECGTPIKKLISAPAVGGSQSGFDDRAKASGFHKLKKLGTGEYEKLY
jgi:putative FmdB family regulatory protein